MSLRRIPLALGALFAVVSLIAAFAYAINAWQVFGFARHVWRLPFVLCLGAAVVADALSLAGLFATYLLRNAPRRVRAYAWIVFLGMTGLSIAAAESFAAWRRLDVGERSQVQPGAMVAAAAIVVALALAVHLLIVANRHARPANVVSVDEAERVAGTPVEVRAMDRQPGVYRAIGPEPSPPLYIGSTRDLAQRIAIHKCSSEWFAEVTRWTFEPYDTIDDAMAAERVLIHAEQPTYNENLRSGAQPRRRKMPEGTLVEQVSPTVDPKNLPAPAAVEPPRRRPAPVIEQPPKRTKRQPTGRPAVDRDDIARRVLAGQLTYEQAMAEGGVKSRRAVEMWVATYREGNLGTADRPVSTLALVPINGYDRAAEGVTS